MKELGSLIRAPLKYRFGFLFLALLMLLALPAILPGRLEDYATPVLFTLVITSGVATVGDRRSALIAALALAVPALVLLWLDPVLPTHTLSLVGGFMILAFLAYAAAAILLHVIGARRVDLEVIYAAICVYLLLAILWGVAYPLVEGLAPGSFNLPDAMQVGSSAGRESQPFIYYSFVTITTLGYGDITPASQLARLLAYFEAVLGQLFLVILIARLVGLYTAQEFAALQQRGDRHDG